MTRPSPGDDGMASINDRGPVGAMGGALLGETVRSVAVEVDSTADASLGQSARDAIEAALREHGRKTSVTFSGSGSIPAQEMYTRADLERLAREHREVSSTAAAIGIHVLVLGGAYEKEGALGVAFDATSVAIFPDRIGAGLIGTLRYDRVEEAVVVHELGHLLGLVNLTGQGGFHEDPEHPGHSANRGSVMYWAVEDVSVATVFTGGPPVAFDADDEAEMDRIRG